MVDIAYDSTSYPYLAVAVWNDVPYRDVLAFVGTLEVRQDRRSTGLHEDVLFTASEMVFIEPWKVATLQAFNVEMAIRRGDRGR